MLGNWREVLARRLPRGAERRFAAGERIHTECSYKFDRDQLRSLAQKSGFELTGIVTDEREWFAESIMHVPAVP